MYPLLPNILNVEVMYVRQCDLNDLINDLVRETEETRKNTDLVNEFVQDEDKNSWDESFLYHIL